MSVARAEMPELPPLFPQLTRITNHKIGDTFGDQPCAVHFFVGVIVADIMVDDDVFTVFVFHKSHLAVVDGGGVGFVLESRGVLTVEVVHAMEIGKECAEHVFDLGTSFHCENEFAADIGIHNSVFGEQEHLVGNVFLIG